MHRILTAGLGLALLAATPGLAADSKVTDTALVQAVYGPQRSAAAVARDTYRHPLEELTFFGIKPTDTVVEIWPSGNYWTQILAPYLHDHGTYYAADEPAHNGESKAADAKETALFAADPATYGNVKRSVFDKDHPDIAPAGSADLIVTFRNLHNWMEQGWADDAMSAFYKALKPGGVLGIEDHRSKLKTPQDPKAASGYIRQDYAIALARKAGFEYVGESEIDANPKDTTDYPKGVWTLPPTYRLGDQDRDKYKAIGEADNFVLKFRKPAN